MSASSASQSLQADSDTRSSLGHSRSLLWFAATTLLGAFLVFQVQPIISKCVLPWFGGTPAVWTTCMLFFQLLLFGGYLYAHALKTYFRPFLQAAIHLSLLSVAALSLPIEPTESWKPTGSESPTFYLLWMLARHVGLPYFVLSSTGPLVQAWLSFQDNSDRIYRLYALSNAGSLFALLSYPFLVEPVLSVSAQSTVWSLMFCLFVLVQGYIAVSLLKWQGGAGQGSDSTDSSPANAPQTTAAVKLAWIGLPALASIMLLVVTNHLCQDIAVVPFLWVLPLSLYLASFIVCFDSPQWYRPKPIAVITLLMFTMIQCKWMLPGPGHLIVEATCYMVMLFGICLLCHGEVARLKPETSSLTQYYAMLSGGGALGGITVALLCPLLLNNYSELPFSMAVSATFAFLLLVACKGWKTAEGYDWSVALRFKYGAIAFLLVQFVTIVCITPGDNILSTRNFFGVLKVRQKPLGTSLVHGITLHGMQRYEPHQSQPTTYYGHNSGVGRVIETLQEEHASLNIGVVGLGCGVLATYGRPSDRFDMIEINPAVLEIANQHFTFMKDCPAKIDCHLGDGRLVLERMEDRRFDLLVLDAFSSDAIPAHLLTRESMALYQSRLAENGVLAIHTSNIHLNLTPLVHRLSDDAKLESRLVFMRGNPEIGTKTSTWMVVAQPGHPIFDAPRLVDAKPATPQQLQSAPLWTDQHHNLVSVLRLW